MTSRAQMRPYAEGCGVRLQIRRRNIIMCGYGIRPPHGKKRDASGALISMAIKVNRGRLSWRKTENVAVAIASLATSTSSLWPTRHKPKRIR